MGFHRLFKGCGLHQVSCALIVNQSVLPNFSNCQCWWQSEQNHRSTIEIMSEKLLQHIRKFIEIDPTNEIEILNFFQSETIRKKENLIEFNDRCKFHYFVVTGCLRMFFIDNKGTEQTIQFAIENWWMTDYSAFENRTLSEFTIQAVEKTEILKIDYKNQEKLLKEFPQLERYFRMIYQRAYSASLTRSKYLYDFSREQFFHHFNQNFPEFTKRIPQHLLASFLNMTPEYLSEIKNKSHS